MNIHHIGYYVENVEAAKQEFILLGYTTEKDCICDEERKIFVQFLKNGSYRVELVAPAEGCTLFPKSMRKMGTMPYHICYECVDMEKTVDEWQGKGLSLVRPPSPAPALGGRRVAFLYSDVIGLIEMKEA